MSPTLKALQHFKNFSISFSKFAFVRPLCSAGQDLITSSSNTPPDFLLLNLKNAHSANNILNLVASHYNIMNTKHIMQALRSVFEIHKQGQSEMSTKELIRDPNFEKLCRKIKIQSGIFEVNETIEALKIISFVGVPSDSQIVQVLLQLIRHNINSLSLRHIMFLEFILSQFKKTPLVEALQIALPLVFEIQLPVKMDRSNVQNVAEYLYFASRANLSKSTVNLIADVLLNMDSRFDAKTAKSVIWSLTEMEPDETFAPLLNKAVNDLVVYIDDVHYPDLETTISKLLFRYSRKYNFFYNEVFFDSCANYVIDRDLGLKNAVYILKKFGRIYHFNKYLTDYMTQKVLDEENFIQNVDSSTIYSIAVALSMTNYRPPQFERLKELIAQCKNLGESTQRDIIWLKYASALCLLNIFKVDVISRALNNEHLENVFRKKFMSDYENYLTIVWSIKLYKPELLDLLPSRFDPINVMRNREIFAFPLEAALQKALGGDAYLITNISSKLGHQIDHAILFRKGGYPVALPKEEYQYVEDINIPPDSQLVVILCLRPINYTINNRILRESSVLSIRILENSGYKVVPVCLEVWENLSDFEKIPYLMQAIKFKTSEEVVSDSIS